MKVFIVGGAGFIGAELSCQLLNAGHDVTIHDAFIDFIGPLKSNYALFLKKRLEKLKDRATIVRGDVRNPGEFTRILQKSSPDKVVFLAALPIASMSNKEPETAISINLNGVINCLEAIKNINSVNQFIYASSSMVYGDFHYFPADENHLTDPKCVYGGVKLSGEILTKVYSKQYGINYTIIRPSAVYGPTDVNRRVSQIFLQNAFTGKPLLLDNGGDSKLDFTYVEDIAQGFFKALTSPGAYNQTFNITTGQGRTLRELAQVIAKLIPSTVIESRSLPENEKRPERGALAISKAQKMLGYSPVYTLETGMQKYFEFEQETGLLNSTLK